MKYPVLIHKESNTEYGVTIPDIPGCFTAGKTIDEALKNLQEAVECYYEGEEINTAPEASNIDDLMSDKDLFTDGGFWALADLDFSFLSKKTVRVNITVPEYKLAMIDKKAKSMNLSRSAFLVASAEAVAELTQGP